MLFVVLALPLGVFLAVSVPLGHVADEPGHLLRADGLLYGGIIGHREPITLPDGKQVIKPGMRADLALLSVVKLPIRPMDPAPPVVTAEMDRQTRAVTWDARPAFIDLGIIAGYMPLFYVPAALALGGAKLVGLAPYQAFIAARVANLLCFTAMGVVSLLAARRGRALMLLTLTVPMTLNLAASASQDGLLIACAVLAAALVTRAAATGASRPVSRAPCYWAAAACIAAVATAKPPYLPMAAMLLLPLPAAGQWRAERAELWRRLAVVVLVALPAFGWAWLNVHYASVAELRAPYEAGPLWSGPRPAIFDRTDMAAQLGILLEVPTRFVTLPVMTILHDASIPPRFIGVLGWLNFPLPGALYRLWAAALAAAVIADCIGTKGTAEPGARWLEPPFLAGAAFLAVLTIYISQYLVWTDVGLDRVVGPQGRYFLPLVPLLALALPRLGVRGGASLRHALLLLPLAAAAADVLVLPRLIVRAYYLG